MHEWVSFILSSPLSAHIYSCSNDLFRVCVLLCSNEVKMTIVVPRRSAVYLSLPLSLSLASWPDIPGGAEKAEHKKQRGVKKRNEKQKG